MEDKEGGRLNACVEGAVRNPFLYPLFSVAVLISRFHFPAPLPEPRHSPALRLQTHSFRRPVSDSDAAACLDRAADRRYVSLPNQVMQYDIPQAAAPRQPPPPLQRVCPPLTPQLRGRGRWRQRPGGTVRGWIEDSRGCPREQPGGQGRTARRRLLLLLPVPHGPPSASMGRQASSAASAAQAASAIAG